MQEGAQTLSLSITAVDSANGAAIDFAFDSLWQAFAGYGRMVLPGIATASREPDLAKRACARQQSMAVQLTYVPYRPPYFQRGTFTCVCGSGQMQCLHSPGTILVHFGQQY